MTQTGENFYIQKRFIDDIELSEIDIDLHDEFGFDYDTFLSFEEIEIGGRGQSDSTPIKIDRLIEKLEYLKNKGATHVSLNYHEDHIGYELSGYEITLANGETIKTAKNAKEAEEFKRKEIARLRATLNTLENTPAKNFIQEEENLPF